jgi:hypothetical protein
MQAHELVGVSTAHGLCGRGREDLGGWADKRATPAKIYTQLVINEALIDQLRGALEFTTRKEWGGWRPQPNQTGREEGRDKIMMLLMKLKTKGCKSCSLSVVPVGTTPRTCGGPRR